MLSEIIFPLEGVSRSGVSRALTRRWAPLPAWARRISAWSIALTVLLPLTLATGGEAAAKTLGRYSGEPLPRFASLKAELVYLRRGPGSEYGILWELRRLHLPVRVIGEHGPWRRVRLHDGERGWIHVAMLTGKRFATPLEGGLAIRRRPSENAEVVARAEPTFPLRVERCDAEWCRVEALGVDGWALRHALWGVERGELLD